MEDRGLNWPYFLSNVTASVTRVTAQAVQEQDEQRRLALTAHKKTLDILKAVVSGQLDPKMVVITDEGAAIRPPLPPMPTHATIPGAGAHVTESSPNPLDHRGMAPLVVHQGMAPLVVHQGPSDEAKVDGLEPEL